jgi:hypothetical protein
MKYVWHRLNKLILFVLLLLPILVHGFGKHDSATWNVSITPQNLINNCIRFDLERRLSNNNWIGFGQQIYYGNIIETNDSIYGPLSTVNRYNTPHKDDAINGVGFVLDDKIFLHPQYKGYAGFYFNFGASYSQFNIGYQDNGWESYQQNGSTYYGYMITNANMKIERYDFLFAFGITSNHPASLHLDITFGGIVQSTNTAYSGLKEGYRNYNRSIFDFQYTGIYPLLTMQMGYIF